MIDKGHSDKELIERYVTGDKSSLPILVQRWHKIFCEKAYWILKDKDLSKDIAQECWMIIINKLHTLRKTESFKSWALRIVYTKAIDAHKLRATNYQKLQRIDYSIDDSSNTNERTALQKRKLLLAIQALRPEKQDIIRLFYLEAYSLKEISLFLKIPVGTVKSRLFKAREKLKTIIKS